MPALARLYCIPWRQNVDLESPRERREREKTNNKKCCGASETERGVRAAEREDYGPEGPGEEGLRHLTGGE